MAHPLQYPCRSGRRTFVPDVAPVEADFEMRDPGEVRKRVGEGVTGVEAVGEGVDAVEEGVGFAVESAAGEEEIGWGVTVAPEERGIGCAQGMMGVEDICVDLKTERGWESQE